MFMKIQGIIQHFHAEIVKWTSERGGIIGQSCETRCLLATRDAATRENVPVSSVFVFRGVIRSLRLWDYPLEFEVSSVNLDKETGIVRHKGRFSVPCRIFPVPLRVSLHIDEEARRLNARLHSAGHLLDAAVKEAGLDGWMPYKG